MKRDHILTKVNENGKYLHEKLMHALGSHKNVGEIRHIGLIHAIELVEDPKTKKAFDPSRRIGWHIFRKAMDLGLVLRPMGDIIYFNPPLNITREDLIGVSPFARKRSKPCWGSRDWWLVTSDW